MPIYELDGLAPELPPEGECWIAPDAHVIGRVKIGRDASIWYGSVIRGDNEPIRIGEGSNIQEGCLLHTDPGLPMEIAAGCTIGHHAVLHGCTIGEGALVGMGATILNGARIGPGCLVGAGALVTEGKSFPEASLIVGAPARAVRTLDEAAVAGLRRTSMHYVENWRRFASRLKRIG